MKLFTNADPDRYIEREGGRHIVLQVLFGHLRWSTASSLRQLRTTHILFLSIKGCEKHLKRGRTDRTLHPIPSGRKKGYVNTE